MRKIGLSLDRSVSPGRGVDATPDLTRPRAFWSVPPTRRTPLPNALVKLMRRSSEKLRPCFRRHVSRATAVRFSGAKGRGRLVVTLIRVAAAARRRGGGAAAARGLAALAARRPRTRSMVDTRRPATCWASCAVCARQIFTALPAAFAARCSASPNADGRPRVSGGLWRRQQVWARRAWASPREAGCGVPATGAVCGFATRRGALRVRGWGVRG